MSCSPGAPARQTAGFFEAETDMADDLSNRGPEDASRVNVNEPHELRYWTRTLGVSEAKLRSAVAAGGTATKDIRDYLGFKQ